MTGSPFLVLPGAVAAEGVDAGVAGHYGNPIVEQRKLERGDAIVDLSGRGVVTVTGPDRLSWLHSMASQALSRLHPGVGTEALLLDASGRIEHAAHVLDVTRRVEQQRLGTLAGREVIDGLAGHRVQPRTTVGARDDHEAAVGKIDDGVTALELALLDDGIAVVPRDAEVERLGGDGAGECEEW